MTLYEKLPQDKEAFHRLSKYDKSELWAEVEAKLQEMPKEKRELENVSTKDLEEIVKEAEAINQFKNYITEEQEERSKLIAEAIISGEIVEAYEAPNEKEKRDKMENIEMRSFQKYITSGYRNMTDEETRALNQAGAAVVIPTEIANKLITDTKYSTLLARATVFQDQRAGKLSIPIASNTSASWKIENSNEDGDSTSYEGTPTLTNIELGGYELYRLARVSSAAHSLASAEFESMMLNLLAGEVVETLEEAFIKGTGSGQPKRLDEVTWIPDTNEIEATTAIEVGDIAAAIALLPAKYAKNAVVMMNTATFADVATLKGTAEYAYNISEGAQKFLGHEIIINEHMADDENYIVDPKELYVRFALPLQVEADRSSGFTKASIDLRALLVVDAAWNEKAIAKVSIGAGAQ